MTRKAHEYHYIYKISNLKNNKYYIGMHSTSDLDDGYFGSGKRLRNSIRHHGKNVHQKEILEYLPDRISLASREKEIVNENLLKDPLCMNLMIGGECGGWINKQHMKKCCDAGNKAFIENMKNNKDLNKKMKEISSSIFKNAWKEGKMKPFDWSGMKHSEETKKLIGDKNSLNSIGDRNSQYNTKWINSGIIDKKIKGDKLDEYIKNGWNLGRIKHVKNI